MLKFGRYFSPKRFLFRCCGELFSLSLSPGVSVCGLPSSDWCSEENGFADIVNTPNLLGGDVIYHAHSPGDRNYDVRVFNFSAGPATLNEEVLAASAAALQNYENSGVGYR